MTPPPMVRTTVPPSISPDKAGVTYESLLGKPTTLNDAGVIGPTAPPSTGPLQLHSAGVPPLILQRDEAGAAVLTVIELKRNGTIHGYIGLDASDQLALIAADGTTVLAVLTNTGELDVLLRVKTPKVLDSAGHQLLTSQQAAIPNAATNGSSGSTESGTAAHASANPTPKADFDALADLVNDLITVTNNNAAGINSIVATLNALVASHNTLLAELRAATGHGLIA